MKRATVTTSQAILQLAELFHKNDYVRRQNLARRQDQGPGVYKKGDEVRLVADTLAQLAETRRMLRTLGFKPGRPFRKDNQFRQPIYGRKKVARFLELVDVEKMA